MKTFKQLEKLRKIHQLIQQESTGTPEELSNRLRISRRQLYNMIEYLKDLDAPVSYKRKTCTFYYKYDFDLLVNISVQVLVKDELTTIYAGRTILEQNFLSARLMHRTNLY